MLTSTPKTRQHGIKLLLLCLLMAFSVSAQVPLVSESFENGGAMPAGWNKTIVSGSDALSFVTTTAHPAGFTAYDGSYMVSFASWSFSSAVNRLYKTAPFSTIGMDGITVDFSWFQSSAYTSADNVIVQYSTDGVTWNNSGTYNRYGSVNEWVMKSDILPAGANNQPTVYIGFLFTSAYGNDCYLDDVFVHANPPDAPPVFSTVGTGTSTYGYPYYTLYEDSRTHMIYDASEIMAGGGVAGDITAIAFDIASFSTYPMNSFTIQMQNYSGTTLTGFVSSGWTTVYGPTLATNTANGWQTYNFSAPFDWDGTSNILVSVCYDNSGWSSNSTVNCTSASGKTWHYHTDGSTGCTMTGGSAQTYRPNARFTIQPPPVLPTGIVQGFVTNAYGVPLPNATVYATGENGDFMTTSGPNGAYSMPTINVGIYTMYAAKEGYNNAIVEDVLILTGQTTYQNFALTQPSMAITPNPYSVTLNPNEWLAGQFNIANNGNGPVAWEAVVEYTNDSRSHAQYPDYLEVRGDIPYGECVSSTGRAPAPAPYAFEYDMPTRDPEDMAYAYVAYEGSSTLTQGPCSFILNNPASITRFGNAASDFIAAADWANDTWYGVVYGGQLLTIDPVTGAYTTIGTTGDFVGISWNAQDEIMYGLTYEGQLETINVLTGAHTLIGTSMAGFIAFEIDNDGVAYAVHMDTDQWGTINLTNGQWTAIGPVGFNVQYAQDMSCDPSTNEMYWAAYDYSAGGKLLLVDKATGTSQLVGAFPGGAEIDGFAIPGSAGASGWLTLGQYAGGVNAFTNFDLPAYFDASGAEAGEVYTANVTFTSTPNVGTVVVPVTMVIAGPALSMPDDLTATLTNAITGQASLSWTFAPADAFLHFIVRRDGVVLGTTTANTFTDVLPTYGTYNYTVQAVYDEGQSSPAGPVELEWPNPTMFVDPLYIYDEVWVNQQAVQTVTISNTGEGTLAFSFPDWVENEGQQHSLLAYCTGSGGCDEHISSVVFNTINNSSGCSGYADYTSISTEVEMGETYTMTLTNPEAWSSDIAGVWIDFNHNEVFTDAGEFFNLTTQGGGASFTGNITIPEDVMSGPTRMRIRLQYGGTLAPCGSQSFGEVEDYTVNVKMAGFIVSVSPASGTIPQGGSKTITIVWDATDFAPNASYLQDLVVESNDLAHPSATIVNEMFVYVPSQLAGTVTDIETNEPLNGVIVTANPRGINKTYILDDGLIANGFGYPAGTGPGGIGNRYVTTDVGYIQRVDAYFDYGAAMSTPLTVRIYDMANNLLGESMPVMITTAGWYSFTLPNVEYSGSFYAVVYWPNIIGSTRYLGWDTDGPNAMAQLSYEYFGGVMTGMHTYGLNGVFAIRPTAFVVGETNPVTYANVSTEKREPVFEVIPMVVNIGRTNMNNDNNRVLTSFQTMTDENGDYSMYVDPGTYDVSFEKTGYQTYVELDTTCLAGEVTTVDAQLREESYPPSFVYAEVNDDDTEVLVTWGDGSGPYEVVYDDGSAENYTAWAFPGNYNAVKFTPASYPATVIGARIYVGDGTFPNNTTGFIGTTFGALVLDDDGPNGMPGTTLDSIAVEVTNYGWMSFTGLDAEITDGNFYIAMLQYTLSPNTAPVGIDEDTPTSYRSYSRNVLAGGAWALSPYQDMMMRAIVFGSPSDGTDMITHTSDVVRVPVKQRGLISQSPAIYAAGGAEGPAIYKAALDIDDNGRSVTGYRVVRYSNFDPDMSPETGTVTLAINNINANEYNDPAWLGLAPGWYAYGVAALYPDGFVSDTIVSNVVGHHIDSEITINVSLTTGGSPAGAFVGMTGLDYPYESYTATVPESGQVIFPEVWNGHYDLLAQMVGFDDYTMSVNVVNDMTINIILAETKYPPTNLYVDPLTLVATWRGPMMTLLTEDFEGATFPPAGWGSYTQNTNGWYAGTVGSASFTIPPHTTFAVANDDEADGDGCCDYLWTPPMDLTESTGWELHFQSFFTGAYSQTASVEISSDGGSTWTVVQNIVANPAWTQLAVDLSAFGGPSGLTNAVFGFHANDNGAWASGWAVDDVVIKKGVNPAMGYGVFLDGALVGNTPETTYTYTNLNYGQEYLAGVAGLYSSGYSELDTYLFRSQYLIPPTNLEGMNPQGTDYVHLTWLAPTVPTLAPSMDALPVIIPQPAADVVTVASTNYVRPQGSAPMSTSRNVLWDNGTIVNSPGTGAGGADESILQGDLGMSTYGSGMQQTAGNSIADDFTVTGTWTVENFEFFGYQTGSSTTSTMTGIFFRIWDGNPMAGGTVIWGDLTTNKLLSTEWSNIYRNNNGPGGATDRPVMRIVADADGLTLTAGQYWVEWTATGSLSSGPWQPPVTINGQTTTGDAIQNQAGTWVALTDVGPQGMPFIINGGGGGGGQTVANLLGYNLYRNDAMIAYVEKPALEYFDLGLDPGTYSYHITAVYDLTPYGYTGQTGESMIEGPISVDVIYGYDLPFFEDWTTGLFETNDWSIDGNNWRIAGQAGNPAPAVEFTYAPQQEEYTLSLTSSWINGFGPDSSFIDGDVYLDFDLKLDDNNATGDEQLLVEVFNGSNWTPFSTFTAEGDMDWEAQHIKITAAAKNTVFRVRFTAKGINTLDINNWLIDNIHIYRLCAAPYNLVTSIPDPVYHADQILVEWEAPTTPVGPSEWIHWDSGTNPGNGVGLTAGGTFQAAARFTPEQLEEWAGSSLTKMRIFPYQAAGCTFVLKVWTGANAGTLVASQPVTFTSDQWNEYTLNTPVYITGSTELWFGFEVTHAAGQFPGGCDEGPAVAGFGDMISTDGATWDPMSTFDLNYNWNIQGYVEGVDGVNQVLEPIANNTVYNNSGNTLALSPVHNVNNPNASVRNREMTGFNLYRNDEFLVFVTETSYLDTDPTISVPESNWCYRVTAVYADCESDFSNEDCELVYSAENTDLSGVSVYPNPANTYVNIELTDEISSIVMYNYAGQIVYQQTIAKDKVVKIDVRDYNSGAYLIKFITRSGESFAKKIAVTN